MLCLDRRTKGKGRRKMRGSANIMLDGTMRYDYFTLIEFELWFKFLAAKDMHHGYSHHCVSWISGDCWGYGGIQDEESTSWWSHEGFPKLSFTYNVVLDSMGVGSCHGQLPAASKNCFIQAPAGTIMPQTCTASIVFKIPTLCWILFCW